MDVNGNTNQSSRRQQLGKDPKMKERSPRTPSPKKKIQASLSRARQTPEHRQYLCFETKTNSSLTARSNRVPIPLPHALVNNIPPFPFSIPPKEHYALPPARKSIMQIETQIPSSLIPRRCCALRCCLAGQDFRSDEKGDGRVGVGWVGVGERAAAGAGGEGVVCGEAG